MLADTAREDDCVDAVERCGVSTDILLIRYAATSTASFAFSLPSLMPFSRSRISELNSLTPSIPHFLLRYCTSSSGVKPSFARINSLAAGSMSPERVPITRPSSGVKPIDVSRHLPSLTAEMDEPLPRWHTMILLSFCREV